MLKPSIFGGGRQRQPRSSFRPRPLVAGSRDYDGGSAPSIRYHSATIRVSAIVNVVPASSRIM